MSLREVHRAFWSAHPPAGEQLAALRIRDMTTPEGAPRRPTLAFSVSTESMDLVLEGGRWYVADHLRGMFTGMVGPVSGTDED